MSSQTVSIKKRTTKIVTDSGSTGDIDYDTDIKTTRRYQVYRGMSPTTSNRLEIRIKELEDALDSEREARMRAEKDVQELTIQLDGLGDRLDEADGLNSAQADISRKRETELTKMRKDMELINVQHESSEASLRKRHQDAMHDLTDQIEGLTRGKSKVEKEKQVLLLEIDSVSTSLDSAMKAKAHAESKADALDDSCRRLKAQVDELTKNNHDLNNLKARLTQENFELQRQVQELDSTNAHLSKAKGQLQHALDEAKSKLDEETRIRNQITIQFNSLQVEFDALSVKYEEEAEAAGSLRGQVVKLQTELQTLRQRYDKDMAARLEELEDLRRRMNARVAELEDLAEQARLRAAKLEKEKNKLVIEIRELTVELETAQANVADLAKRLKMAESANADLARRVDELSTDLHHAQADNARLAAENARLKQVVSDLEARNDALARENKNLSESLREAQAANKDLSRSVAELTTIRVQLEGERDSLAAELADTRDALKEAQARLDAANAALSHLRSEMDHRLREKDEEIESIRKSSQRALDELQRTIIEIETKYKAEISRIKKKYEMEIREFEIQIETLTRTNSELAKNNKALSGRVKELELNLDDERRAGDEARQAVTVLERKRIALQTELEDVRTLLETAERARKAAEGELHEASSRVNELTISVTGLANDKRRMESDIAAMHADLDDALGGRRGAEERADRLQAEVNRLADELRQETENFKNADSIRKSLEIEIREITVRLEEAEAFAQREGKRMVAKLQARLRDLEGELELEQRRAREFGAQNRKIERQYNEIRIQIEDEIRVKVELQDANNTLGNRVRTLRRQLEEAEEVVTITMNKYRKGQQMLEEAEHRADIAEKSVSVRGRGRSMSVSREITKIVRV